MPIWGGLGWIWPKWRGFRWPDTLTDGGESERPKERASKVRVGSFTLQGLLS